MPFLYFLRTIQLGYSQNKNKTGGSFIRNGIAMIFLYMQGIYKIQVFSTIVN